MKDEDVKINISDAGNLVVDDTMAVATVLSSDDLVQSLDELAAEVLSFCANRSIDKIKVVGIAKACLPIMTTMIFLLGKRCIDYDFLILESYKKDKRLDDIKVRYKPKVKFCKNEVVLIIDTMLDTGHTMKKAVEIIGDLGAKFVMTCALLKKNRTDGVCVYPHLNFVGFSAPDVFMAGYGLDHDGRYRNIPGIYDTMELDKYKHDKDILDTIIYNNIDYEESVEEEIEEDGEDFGESDESGTNA